mmetsp:Transcript_20182/g.42407  ORF Transcript_20182/g.42407 Transcript_20182/m.42407 type:complete len:83 (-) Transcript_20182:882-1130(-)
MSSYYKHHYIISCSVSIDNFSFKPTYDLQNDSGLYHLILLFCYQPFLSLSLFPDVGVCRGFAVLVEDLCPFYLHPGTLYKSS